MSFIFNFSNWDSFILTCYEAVWIYFVSTTQLELVWDKKLTENLKQTSENCCSGKILQLWLWSLLPCLLHWQRQDCGDSSFQRQAKTNQVATSSKVKSRHCKKVSQKSKVIRERLLFSSDCPPTPATTTWGWNTTPRSTLWTPSPTLTSTRKPSWFPTTRFCPPIVSRRLTPVQTRGRPTLKLPPNPCSCKDL